MPEIPGFRVKYAGIEVEFWSQDNTTVANNYRSLLEWLKNTIEKKLAELERQIVELKQDLAEIKELRNTRGR